MDESSDAAWTLLSMRDSKLDESSDAAWTLLSMRDSKLDEKSATALRHELKKRENNVPSELNPPAINEPEPQDHLSSIPGLRGLIGQRFLPYDKKLTHSDATPKCSEIIINAQFVREYILPFLNEHEHLNDIGFLVTVYDLRGNQYRMTFKHRSSNKYVLMEGWTQFRRANNLNRDDVVRLSMFRHLETRQLCFGISSVMMNE